MKQTTVYVPSLDEALSQHYAELRRENREEYEQESPKAKGKNHERYRVPIFKENSGREGKQENFQKEKGNDTGRAVS